MTSPAETQSAVNAEIDTKDWFRSATNNATVGTPAITIKQEPSSGEITTETSPNSSKLYVVTCRRCDEVFSARASYDVHIVTEHNGVEIDVVCDSSQCDMATVSNNRSCDSVFTRQKCEGCQKSFDSAKTWRMHQKLHAVHYDDVMMANLSTYNSHEEANIAEGVCPHCEKFNFVSNKAFLAHLVEKHGQLIFCCSYLSRRCRYTHRVGRDEADRHMRTVHGAEQAVICPVCYKMFCTEFTMQKHNFVHNHGVCPVCTKLFRCKKNYIYHLRTHTDYTPLNRCPYCNYQPPRSKSLNKRSSYLMTHIRNAHADVAPDCSTSKVRELLLAQRNGSVVAQPLTSGTCHRRTDTNTTSPANADAICEDEVAQ